MLDKSEVREIIIYVVDKAMESRDITVSVNFYADNVEVSTYRMEGEK